MNTLAILVGGGPAPGINTVIASVGIEALNRGFKVLGIQDGFKWLVRGDTTHVQQLQLGDLTHIHLDGGSILGTSRENPTKSQKAMQAVIDTLQKLGVTHLVTIGGDDTALSSSYVAGQSDIRTVHVPKTIDNDLPLPEHVPTFGFQTARSEGTLLVQNLMEDARSTLRWYIVVAMGRKAGHLALGIGKAAGATLTLIAEEFRQDRVPFATICDIIEASIIKRRAAGRYFGVAVLAEGLIEKLDPAELAELQDVERDDHGHIRFAEIDLARKVKAELQGRFLQRGIKIAITNKNLGYELRCCPPVAFDVEYCRDLGYAAVSFLLSGGSSAIITVQDGEVVPISFEDIRDKETGKTRVRLVDISSESYRIARKYMIRLEQADLQSGQQLRLLAKAGNMDVETFKRRFAYLVEGER
ncbi:MAG: diphosphate--fructose-6-phosphate 1-phosphotransferase [Acidobacteriota bacterium]|nr:diphosphate--fructose-6-phosphate 1-phosphotransferase [Blastocatellia bacterium]MDW8411277.1 diphosphate--fructose-6-phosphate 1-phosphotransferase [Acidobacteriota bacterium]